MSWLYNVEEEYDKVCKKCDDKYKDYMTKAKQKKSEYMGLCDKYNGEISIINNERISMREEINKLYSFLKDIGGSMGKKIDVFDFKVEFSAIRDDMPFEEKLDKPILENTHVMTDALIKTMSIRNKNKNAIAEFDTKISSKELEYTKDISERNRKIEFINDANEIATVYREVVVIIRDEIRDKIIPELGLIKAFLYADVIREQILDGENPRFVHPYSIEEYQGTAQDIHYQFVKNVFDFYNISIHFFKQTILADIIESYEISEEKRKYFFDQIEEVKKSISLIEERKVL